MSEKAFVKHDDHFKYDGKAFMRAGPRLHISFKPETVKVAIVTCGGLCPGLNVVIREIVMSLYYNYGVKTIYGIKWGYSGFYEDNFKHWIPLSPNVVTDIHTQGGTILGSSRGGFDAIKICDALETKGINMIFGIGGDGTQRGIASLNEEINKRKLKIVLAGIPKTIDNDIPLIDRSFGFESAVEEAVKAISSANVEANCVPNGIGLVKLFGRSCGFIAMEATMASRDVNICLIPEAKYNLYGEKGLLSFIFKRLKLKGHCVIVVAEGAGNFFLIQVSPAMI
jgi:6-phosphofructokinase 1